ncbi:MULTISPECIES: hypothetical protein [Flavobacterium]|uniref:hypothetical protein n=1 Tax=Flavobacterium TaxID=237 RepID=UPI00095C42D9|nr:MULTISPECIES: hypothetical protein [Flavobacterium]MBN9285494.1 hypothetical protein [Flavobacterium sp.]OJV71484.1 MAG: hypothetical protein BGO42_06415 [Flavobacterium sp. 40-81]
METTTTNDIKKQQKTLKILSSIFALFAWLVALGTIIGTGYLLFTPRGIGAWILPAFTFIAGFLIFLFLYAFAKIINILIEISNR